MCDLSCDVNYCAWATYMVNYVSTLSCISPPSKAVSYTPKTVF